MHGLLRCIALALALAGSCSVGSSRADDYPSRPVRLIVPYAPGGGADTVARIVARRVSDTIGQPIVIENRGGAGSIIGTDMVAKAEPDGYTLLLGQSGPISINPAVYKDLRYDPVKDFAPITMTTAYPYILVGQRQAAGQIAAGLRRAGQEQAGRVELRDHRHRRRQSSGHRAVQQQGRAQDDAHPLSRHRAGGRRPGRRPGQHGVRRSDQRAAASCRPARCARWR